MADFTDVSINANPANRGLDALIAWNDQGPSDYVNEMDFSTTFNDGNTGGVVYHLNRVYDSVAGSFVYWVTEIVDSTGTVYPGPGVFGLTATGYSFGVISG